MVLKLVLWLSLIAEQFFAITGFDGRIVGGKETSILSHPYQASIQSFGYHSCGAALISDRFIVTAAHCATG